MTPLFCPVTRRSFLVRTAQLTTATIAVPWIARAAPPAAKILEAAKVAVEPETNFGPQYGQFVRFNFATSKENISEAIDRISAL